ncbi:hypothetical protein K438DRAFT_1747318 [Mycena galopus ATCC 62051]|nr:hypothetical protein K438DRAFT_1747318 [Mycena galopus ATCC 62051]
MFLTFEWAEPFWSWTLPPLTGCFSKKKKWRTKMWAAHYRVFLGMVRTLFKCELKFHAADLQDKKRKNNSGSRIKSAEFGMVNLFMNTKELLISNMARAAVEPVSKFCFKFSLSFRLNADTLLFVEGAFLKAVGGISIVANRWNRIVQGIIHGPRIIMWGPPFLSHAQAGVERVSPALIHSIDHIKNPLQIWTSRIKFSRWGPLTIDRAFLGGFMREKKPTEAAMARAGVEPGSPEVHRMWATQPF